MDEIVQAASTVRDSAQQRPSGLRFALRWIVLLPAFGILLLMTTNITLGFAAWYVTQTLLLMVVLGPVALLLLALNGCAAYLSCAIAPNRRAAAVILGGAYLSGMALGYLRFGWPALTATVFGLASVAVLGGLALAVRRRPIAEKA